MRGPLQGHSTTPLRMFPYVAMKFMAYDQVHHVSLAIFFLLALLTSRNQVIMHTKESETNLRRFSTGAISGTT